MDGYNSIFTQWKPYGLSRDREKKHSFWVSHRKTTLDQVDLTDFRSHQEQNGFVHLNSDLLSLHIWQLFYAKSQPSWNQQITQNNSSTHLVHLKNERIKS